MQSIFFEKKLLENERWELRAVKFPHTQDPSLSLYELARSLFQPAGRFQSPLSFFERLQLKLTAASKPLDFFSLSKNFFYISPRPFLPPEWQVLLRYLYKKRLITKYLPEFHFFRHDKPKNFTLTLPYRAGEQAKISNAHSFSYDVALSKVVGELLERELLTRGKSDTRASFAELKRKKNVVNPLSFSHFLPEQRQKNMRFQLHDETTLSWKKVKKWGSDEGWYIPTQCVFLSYQGISQEPLLRQPTTSGSAGHFSKQRAMLSALYELVERDGFLIFWLNSIAPPCIVRESLHDESLLKEIEYVERYGYQVYFLNTTTDIGIPSFVCVLVDLSDEEPSIALGCSSGYDIYSVLKTCLHEALSCDDTDGEYKLGEEYEAFTDADLGKLERVRVWKNPAMYKHFKFFLEGKKQNVDEITEDLPTFSGEKEEYEYVREKFLRFGEGYEVYYYEVSHPVLSRLGYHVVRVVVPKLIPMYLNEVFAPTGATRISNTPKRLGYVSTNTLNPFPHPFP